MLRQKEKSVSHHSMGFRRKKLRSGPSPRDSFIAVPDHLRQFPGLLPLPFELQQPLVMAPFPSP
jgi:hypothetical protein